MEGMREAGKMRRGVTKEKPWFYVFLTQKRYPAILLYINLWQEKLN